MLKRIRMHSHCVYTCTYVHTYIPWHGIFPTGAYNRGANNCSGAALARAGEHGFAASFGEGVGVGVLASVTVKIMCMRVGLRGW
jgi:hypothetical protein